MSDHTQNDPAQNVPTLEPVWLVEASYVVNAIEARVPFRPTHLARITDLKNSGVMIEAGAYADVSASLFMLRAATEDEALDICRADVYWQNGIWVDLKARAFARVP